MGVNRNEDWGALGMVPEDAQTAGSNADLLKVLGDLNSASVVVLTGGDLCRTLGGRGRACPGGEATLVDIDVGEALVDGRLHRFVSHFVVRPSRHPGRWWVAANAAHRGRWNLAPRAMERGAKGHGTWRDGPLNLARRAMEPGAKGHGTWREGPWNLA